MLRSTMREAITQKATVLMANWIAGHQLILGTPTSTLVGRSLIRTTCRSTLTLTKAAVTTERLLIGSSLSLTVMANLKVILLLVTDLDQRMNICRRSAIKTGLNLQDLKLLLTRKNLTLIRRRLSNKNRLKKVLETSISILNVIRLQHAKAPRLLILDQVSKINSILSNKTPLLMETNSITMVTDSRHLKATDNSLVELKRALLLIADLTNSHHNQALRPLTLNSPHQYLTQSCLLLLNLTQIKMPFSLHLDSGGNPHDLVKS